MQMAYTRFPCLLAAGLVVAGFSGRVNLEIPQELLNADTEEALLLGLSQSDGFSLEGSWKYVSEKDPTKIRAAV